MRFTTLLCSALLSGSLFFTSCSDNSTSSNPTNTTSDSTTVTTASTYDSASVKEEAVNYSVGGQTFNGYVAYADNNPNKRPIVLVVHEWWGLTDYPRMRAKQLAAMGYLAMAVDMFGNGKTASNPQEAQALAGPFYQSPQLARTRLDAALAKAKTYAQADTTQTAAIGYCYGGFVALNAAELGADLDGVVSFHGNLGGVQPNKELLKAKVLVCHGGADSFVPETEVAAFKKSMDSIGANYQFKVYPNATHAFTNPDATEVGKKNNMPIKYNGAADTASWNDMKAFFATVFHK